MAKREVLPAVTLQDQDIDRKATGRGFKPVLPRSSRLGKRGTKRQTKPRRGSR
jgi:hypothetical protein